MVTVTGSVIALTQVMISFVLENLDYTFVKYFCSSFSIIFFLFHFILGKLMANPAKKTIQLFYDVVSPYSWFAFEILCRYKTKWPIDLQLKPIFNGGLLAGIEGLVSLHNVRLPTVNTK